MFMFLLEEIETSDPKTPPPCDGPLTIDEMKGNIMTEYEEKFSSKGNPICKLIASR